MNHAGRIGRIVAAFAALAILTACSGEKKIAVAPPAQEITVDAVGHYCGMNLHEHVGPKGQLFLVGQDKPVWFTTVKQVFAYTILPEEPKGIAAIYVTDMSQVENWQNPVPGPWIDAKKAVYVIESRFIGGMGAEDALPFGDESRARLFVAEHGGRIVAFDQMPENYVMYYEGQPS